MRRTVLLVPSAGAGLWSARSGGVRWICAFTDETALARFAVHHGPGDRPMDYVALLGARIVDEIVPALDEPAGIAVDIADTDGAMFFPPVNGIVPPGAAVDAGLTDPTGPVGPTRPVGSSPPAGPAEGRSGREW
ncbi:SseB family protein [Streptomyces sp. NPDC056049]|uniref:SseB family protein n=1 Tax=Streptomyces sp. NPDC056049 TaxID=3345693 RepID=UPI0035E09E92